MKNKITFFIILIIAAFVFYMLDEYGTTQPTMTSTKCTQEFANGKSVGRSAMLTYLSQTNQLDTSGVTIEIMDLMHLEDSLEDAQKSKH